MVAAVALIAVAVVLGSIPTGLIIARRRGVDLRQVGSGNIGASNVGRALGRGWAVAVLVLDALKGVAPVLAARALDGPVWLPAAAGLAAVIGHSFSLFLGGRGGKGVATSLGAALGLAPIPALACFAVYAVLYAAFRISSIGSLAGVIAFPIFLAILGPRDPAAFTFAVTVAALVIVRHKDNITRLRKGEELKA